MLSTLDYVILAAMMVVFLCVGFLFRTREKTTVEEYLISNRNMSHWPVGFSIAVTMYSGVALTVVIGEVYLYGAPVWTGLLSGILAHLILNRTVVPYFYRSKYTSIYQYIEERFSKQLRLFCLLVYFVGGLLFVAVATYVACMSMNIIAGIPMWLSALLVGTVCTIYSAAGGIKAVIWTDVIQACTMYLFSFMIIGQVLSDTDSLSSFWNKAVSGGRLHFSIREGPTVRYSVLSFFGTYTVYWLGFLGTNQACVQRWQCVNTLDSAKRSVTISMWLCGAFGICSYFSGVCLYVYYQGCDVLSTGEVASNERISLHYMVTKFGHLPGLVGVALSGVLNGSFSTFSSVVNSFSAVTLDDFIKPRYKNLTNKQQILICKSLTVFYGAVCTGLVFVVSHSGSAIVVQGITLAVTAGPMFAILMLGILFKGASTKGVTIGMVIAIALVTWMSIGSVFYEVKHEKLPLDVSGCVDFNNTELVPKSQEIIGPHSNDHIFPLYTVSFYWFAPIGLLLAFVLGLTLSYTCFRNREPVQTIEWTLVKGWKRKLKSNNKMNPESREVHTQDSCSKSEVTAC